jgi:5'-deoxynucleotidase YfbR-like HD superfamily hydrolase
MIAHKLNNEISGKISVNMGLLLGKALLHDVEEQFTGDIVRPVKYSNDGVKHSINRMCEEMVKDYFIELTDPVISEDLCRGWRNAKDGSIEGKIVAFADFLSVLSYLNEEVHAGNHIIMRSVDLTNYVKKFKTDEYNFIREMVNATHPVVYNLEQIKRRI